LMVRAMLVRERSLFGSSIRQITAEKCPVEGASRIVEGLRIRGLSPDIDDSVTNCLPAR
jgi:hypothetical protein